MRTFILAAAVAITAPVGASAQHAAAAPQAGAASTPSAAVAAPAAVAPAKSVFAVVDGVVIGTDEYDIAWATIQRQKFYHRSVPEAEVLKLRREVGDQLIDRVLLSAEAKRRGVEPDHAKVREQISGFENRYKASPQWKQIEAERLPALTRELERQTTVERLQADVRSVAPPAEPVVRAYYDAHPELFTEPEQLRLAVILLRVDPSSPAATWDKARDEAVAIRERIDRGADFGELARLHSGDISADKGGDMGYVHRGMLQNEIADELSKLPQGGVTPPLRLLEGYALARFLDRKPPQLRAFEQVRERAGQLWMREESERRWTAFLAELRKGATVNVVDASRYPSSADASRAR